MFQNQSQSRDGVVVEDGEVGDQEEEEEEVGPADGTPEAREAGIQVEQEEDGVVASQEVEGDKGEEEEVDGEGGGWQGNPSTTTVGP